MTLTDLKFFIVLIAIAFVAGISAARSQDGAHDHPELAAEIDDTVSASLLRDGALGDEIDALKSVQSAQGAALADAVSRIEALEKAGPVEPPVDPDPQLPSVTVFTQSGAAVTIAAGGTAAVSGPFNVCISNDAGAEGPVSISWPSGEKTEGQSLYCAAGGNEGTEAFLTLPAADYAFVFDAGNLDPFTVTITVEARAPPVDPPVPPTEPGDTMIQVGPWVPNTSNTEEPFINIVRASSVSWTETDAINTQELYDSGVLDMATGLPRRMPPNGFLRTGVYFATFPDKSQWAGDWLLLWDTACGPDGADLKMHWFPDSQQSKQASGRVAFSRTASNDHAAIRALRIECPLTDLAVIRVENEQAYNAGLIYNPRFIDEASKYHIVRAMDLQEANRDGVRSVADLPGMDAAFWNNISYQSSTDHPFRSMPLAAVVALATEADTMLWHHAPIGLGIEESFFGKTVGEFVTLGREKGRAALKSSAWDDYADAFISALDKGGYSAKRTLYTTVSNEVWNFASQYGLSTFYARGLGQNFAGNDYPFREGYGRLLGRYALAMERAMERSGRQQSIVYVVEGQAANGWTTALALEHVKAFLEGEGEDWADWKDKFGVSVASYWGGMPNWRAAGTVDDWRNPTPEFWRRVEDRILNGPDAEIASLPWVLARFADHEREAAKFGVRLIGAYEGGSHFEKPGEMPREAFEAWHWGEPGARINKAVNDALAEAYPGIILSNYVLAGPKGGQPWFDGELGDDGPMNQSWEAYQREQ